MRVEYSRESYGGYMKHTKLLDAEAILNIVEKLEGPVAGSAGHCDKAEWDGCGGIRLEWSVYES